MKQQIFLKNCLMCKKETDHLISKINKTRGVKLRCLECGHINLRYSKLNKLKMKNE